MQKRDITIIAVRIMALYFIVLYGLALLNNAITLGLHGTEYAASGEVKLSDIIGLTPGFIIGIVLWFCSTPLTKLITKDLSNASPSKKEFTLAGVQVVAVSMFGLLILSYSIPSFFLKFIFITRISTPVLTFIPDAINLGLGFLLLLGAKGIVTAIRKIWAKGKTI
jgi:hypothetical protein